MCPLKTWREVSPSDQLLPKWKGPYQVLLSSTTSVKLQEITSWVNLSRIKPPPPPESSQGTEDLGQPEESYHSGYLGTSSPASGPDLSGRNQDHFVPGLLLMRTTGQSAPTG